MDPDARGWNMRSQDEVRRELAGESPSPTCPYCEGRLDRPGLHGCSVGGHVDPDLARRVVAAIERDMDDRRGMGLGSFDDETRVEIRDAWAAIVRKELLR